MIGYLVLPLIRMGPALSTWLLHLALRLERFRIVRLIVAAELRAEIVGPLPQQLIRVEQALAARRADELWDHLDQLDAIASRADRRRPDARASRMPRQVLGEADP